MAMDNPAAAPDPWDDGPAIAAHLQRPGAELLVVLGAEAWCDKCRRLRPRFEVVCRAQMPVHVLWMWLDLEEHAEFLGDFVPADLPLLLRWREGRCVQASIIKDIDPQSSSPAARVQLQELTLEGDNACLDPIDGEVQVLPPLWRMFAERA
jgi:hypothetical protein